MRPTARLTGALRRTTRPSACAVLALLAGACGAAPESAGSRSARPSPVKRLPPDYLPLTLGAGSRYRPPATSARVRGAAPIDGLRCLRTAGARSGAHLEVFAHQHVVAIPAGIGVTPPLTLVADATVRGGRCYYPALTTDPTGVIDVRGGARVTLGELFDIWGQPLGQRVVARFAAPAGSRVVAYVDGRRWAASPRTIVLSRHARIVLEVAGHVPPHRAYLFRRGL